MEICFSALFRIPLELAKFYGYLRAKAFNGLRELSDNEEDSEEEDVGFDDF